MSENNAAPADDAEFWRQVENATRAGGFKMVKRLVKEKIAALSAAMEVFANGHRMVCRFALKHAELQHKNNPTHESGEILANIRSTMARKQNDNAIEWMAQMKERATKAEGEREKFKSALDKINEIRNSIVAFQTINWSADIYPLVAALNEAGIKGMSYDRAKPHYATLLERAESAEAELAIMREELQQYKEWSEYACKRYKDETGRDLQASAG